MPRKNVGLLFFIALLSLVDSPTAVAQRPAAPRLLPEKTLAYARVADASEMRGAFRGSSLGRMLQDEQMRPLVDELYGGAANLFEQVSERIGISLDELLSIPQGELAVAVVPLQGPEPPAETPSETGPKDDSREAVLRRIEARRNIHPVGFIALVEAGENAPLLMRMVERLEERLQRRGYRRFTSTTAGTEVVTFRGWRKLPVSYAEREGVVVLGMGLGLVDDLLARWEGRDSGPTLAQNTDFGNVMSHCVGAEASRPQVTFYVDPYHLGERLTSSAGGSAAVAWTILQSLQFDKVEGVGGSLFMGGEEGFDSIMHLHLLLESPRDGMLAVVRPGEGSVQPEDWVPAEILSYTTFHWDVLKTYEGVDGIVSRFQGDDALQRLVESRLKERSGVDLRTEILEQLTGRISLVRWLEPPARVNSETTSWVFQVKDPVAFQATLEKLSAGFGNALRKESLGGTTIYVRAAESPREASTGVRRPEHTIAILDDKMIASDSRKAIESFIQARGGGATRLNQSPDYALIAGEISGKLDSQMPFLFSYFRSEALFRQLYDLAKEPRNREYLRRAGQNNPAAKMLVEALERNELPAFSAFSKYFPPSGAFAYDDPTGLHYTGFALKPLE